MIFKLNDISHFWRFDPVKQLVTKNKKTIDHKALIFFPDFDIKNLRLANLFYWMVLLYIQQALYKQLYLFIMIII